MNKAILIWAIVAIAAVLVVGAISVSANLAGKDATVNAPKVCNAVQQACNKESCNTQCGGTCGVKSCGCGK